MHITHWVPSSGKRPAWPCVESWLSTEYPDGCEHSFVRSIPGNVHVIWNNVVRNFLNSNSDYLWSTHDDIQYLPGTLKRLLSWDKPLISALVFMRHNPVVPHIWKQYEGFNDYYAYRVVDTREWFYKHSEYIKFGPFVMAERPDDALVEVNFTSTACTLVHRSVLEAMTEFCGEMWWQFDDEQAGGGEDRRFHETAKLAGYPGFVDRSVSAGHMAGDIATGSADFIAWDSISDFKDTGEPDHLKMLETATRLEG